jgi:hypothetical protein
MAKRFGEGVSNAQMDLARKIERAGLTSYSQAVKAFQRGDNKQIEEWKKQLQQKQESN